MSALICLIAMTAVGWLILWTIRDPKQTKWEWWPFDTEDEAKIEQAVLDDHIASAAPAGRRAIPWRERRDQRQRSARSANQRHD